MDYRQPECYKWLKLQWVNFEPFETKGATIGMVSTAGGIASAVIPALTGIILKYYDILHVFYFLMIIFAVGIFCAIFTKIRYDKVISNN